MNHLLAGLVCILAFHAGPALASGSARFNDFLVATQSATASFQQSVRDRNGKVVQESKGTLAILRPGRFRWAYLKPYPQLIVGDGSKVWIYDEDLNQVTVKKMDQALGSTPAALLAGNNEALKAFSVTEFGVKGGLEWLEAVPRGKESTFERLRLGFGFSGLEVMELVDGFGQTTLIRFTTFERNPHIDPGQFRFSPPKGADVIGDLK